MSSLFCSADTKGPRCKFGEGWGIEQGCGNEAIDGARGSGCHLRLRGKEEEESLDREASVTALVIQFVVGRLGERENVHTQRRGEN
jgi:hypothetical protein